MKDKTHRAFRLSIHIGLLVFFTIAAGPIQGEVLSIENFRGKVKAVYKSGDYLLFRTTYNSSHFKESINNSSNWLEVQIFSMIDSVKADSVFFSLPHVMAFINENEMNDYRGEQMKNRIALHINAINSIYHYPRKAFTGSRMAEYGVYGLLMAPIISLKFKPLGIDLDRFVWSSSISGLIISSGLTVYLLNRPTLYIFHSTAGYIEFKNSKPARIASR